jgi:hypothetical protein
MIVTVLFPRKKEDGSDGELGQEIADILGSAENGIEVLVNPLTPMGPHAAIVLIGAFDHEKVRGMLGLNPHDFITASGTEASLKKMGLLPFRL